jgi:hypothetical protein
MIIVTRIIWYKIKKNVDTIVLKKNEGKKYIAITVIKNVKETTSNTTSAFSGRWPFL